MARLWRRKKPGRLDGLRSARRMSRKIESQQRARSQHSALFWPTSSSTETRGPSSNQSPLRKFQTISITSNTPWTLVRFLTSWNRTSTNSYRSSLPNATSYSRTAKFTTRKTALFISKLLGMAMQGCSDARDRVFALTTSRFFQVPMFAKAFV